jgi:hypothetical protein
MTVSERRRGLELEIWITVYPVSTNFCKGIYPCRLLEVLITVIERPST